MPIAIRESFKYNSKTKKRIGDGQFQTIISANQCESIRETFTPIRFLWRPSERYFSCDLSFLAHTSNV